MFNYFLVEHKGEFLSLCTTFLCIKSFKGDITNTVSANLMLVLRTYKVVLHPSYL